MTTLPGFGGQAAITIMGNGALSYRDDNASPLMNYVTGYALNIESNGDVGGTPGSVTIFTGGNISGARGGILTDNWGTGSTSITATGTVTGNDFYNGIQAVNGAGAKNLTINATEVNGAGRGISARNDGTGFTTIVATGNVTGGLADAIWASASTASTADPATGNNLAITVQNASGATGVWAENYGKAGTSITAKGLVEGYSWGIVGYNAASAKALTIEAANVYSDNGMGIAALNLGTGKTVITTTGATFGNTFGISAYSANGLTITTGDVASYNIAIEATSTDTGAVSVTTNGKVGGAVHGIVAQNSANGTDLSITTLDTVAGGTWGISAQNSGTGATSITTKGLVAAGDTGVLALNVSLNSKDLTVNVADVTAGAIGVFAVNQGTGNTSITATGKVIGNSFYNGIQAVNGARAGNLTINANEVDGGGAGISARNDGFGFTTVVATGDVIGRSTHGVWARVGAATTADPATGNNLAITVQNASGAGDAGVWAENHGTAGTSITAKGLVSGYNWGIFANNDASAKGLTIEAANVYSDNGTGIEVQNLGTGKTVITTTGATFGNTFGISASSANGLTITTGDVASYNIAIVATSTDMGAVSVTTNGKVGGSLYGIVAQNTGSGTDLSVTTLDTVAGGTWGISAQNSGTGATSITTKGSVAAGDTGVVAMNSSLSSKDLTVNVMDVTAGAIGVFAVNQGTGNTRVAVEGTVTGQTGAGIVAAGRSGTTEVINRGLIEGQQAAVSVDSGSASGSLVHNAASGTLRNISGLSSSLAVAFNGAFAAPATLTNDGSILGTVLVTNAAARFTNNGSWNSIGGVSDFGGSAGSQMINANAGTIVAGMNAGVAETTQFANLPQFINRGLMTLADGGVGDVIRTSGNVRFAAGSSLAVDFGGGGADLLHAGGSADFTGGTLIVKPTSTMAVGERYKVVTADGGVTGSFASVNGGNIFLVFKDTYDANDVWLEFVRYRTFVEFGQTPNQISTALGLATTRSGPLFDALMGMSSEAVLLRNALDQLSGEVHPSSRTALMEDSRFVRDGVISRLRSAFDAPGAGPVPVMSYAAGGPTLAPGAPPELFSIWGQTYGSWGSFNGNGNAATLNRSVGGLTTGIDTPIFGTVEMPVRVGVMTGYSHTNFSVGERLSSGASSNYHLGAYAGTQIGGFGLRAGVAHTWHDIHTSRFINFGNFSNLLSADYHGRTTQVFGDLGYKIGFGALQIEPFAGLSYESLTTSAFRENGGVAALANAGTRSSQTFSTLGTRGSLVFDVANMATTLRGALGWRHAFNDVTPGSTFAFSGGVPFNISGIAIARDAAVVEAGVDVAIGAGLTLGINYTGQYANSVRDHSVKGNLTVKF